MHYLNKNNNKKKRCEVHYFFADAFALYQLIFMLILCFSHLGNRSHCQYRPLLVVGRQS